MAVIKVTKGGKSLKSVINYVERKAQLVSGKDCSNDPALANEEMQLTKQLYEKTDGRQYKHYIQSFAPGEISPQKAHELGQEWAERVFKGYEVFIATHTDKEHVHNHFVVNSVNFETGYKIQSSKQDLEHLKKQNDLLCEREGLSVPENKKDLCKSKGQVRTYDMKKYQLLKKFEQGENVKSFVLDTAIAVSSALEQTVSKEIFIEKLIKQGYSVDWQEHKKHVTFITPEGKKVRASNLEKTFSETRFSKEGMLDEFERFEKERARTIRATSYEGQFGNLGIRPVSTAASKTLGSCDTDKIPGNIQRELQQFKERTESSIRGNKASKRGFER